MTAKSAPDPREHALRAILDAWRGLQRAARRYGKTAPQNDKLRRAAIKYVRTLDRVHAMFLSQATVPR